MYGQILSITINKIKENHYNYRNIMNEEQEVISRLKFIGRINKGEKINTHNICVQPDSVVTSWKRTFWSYDNRNNSLLMIQNTISRAFDLLSKYDNSNNTSEELLIPNLINDLENATTGIKNLQVTYKDDTKFFCDLDTVIENINAKLSNFLDKKNKK